MLQMYLNVSIESAFFGYYEEITTREVNCLQSHGKHKLNQYILEQGKVCGI